MADRSDLTVAPGQKYIEVEYDYEYKFKERMIAIKQGECYLLVNKTNDDWWQVRKEESGKAFYVPARYVREVRRALMPPSKPLSNTGGTVLSRGGSGKDRTVALEPKPLEDVNKRSPGQQIALQPPKEDKGSPKSPRNHGQQMVLLPLARADSPIGHRAPLDLDGDSNRDGEKLRDRDRGKRKGGSAKERRVGNGEKDKTIASGESPRETSERNLNDSESGEELSSSSTEQLQVRPDSPVYANLQDLKITQTSLPPLPTTTPLNTIGEWETHQDANGRHFYYNHTTQERTWKPPRARDSLGKKEERNLTPNTDSEASRNTSKSYSLDRKQPAPLPINKWRHSTCILETNDKISQLSSVNLKLKQKSIKTRRVFSLRSGSVRPHPYRPQESSKAGTPDSESGEPSSPKQPHSPFEKSGMLNMTKITENGKKVRKNWTSYCTVLQGSQLIFGKNSGNSASWFGGHQSKPEFTVDLRGATIDKAPKDKSSRKHVLEVKIRQGTEILIQSETENNINEWFKSLTDAINTHACESDEAIEDDMPESPGPDKHDKEKEKEQEQQKKKKLKKFLTRRPTLQTVKDKGYIKDQVFGCNMTSLCQREKSNVPQFVRMCIEHIENEGLNVDGIYRVSGNLAVIQKLRFAVNHDEKINLADSKWEDIHVATGALKMFFRELPEPLFTYALFNAFVSAIKISDYKQKIQSVKDLVKQLPRTNQETMQFLFKHLRKVIEHGELNRMTTQSVAIVFGPTLLRPEIETPTMAFHMMYPNQIVELILTEYETVFNR